ncbi:glycoside hydrolase family 30 protein [Sphingomonas nostoxanthinifaciens]|uniref:glycoside hydrolase family 30 protein n=1 Tax=Sphingomonas nostoxanthinifaciens TaxID=2872652 RepID=UPI001CC21C64|nr:glycoside hydrolase family 30 beta sandwich domain-containing protein [Sphingomonas nostoxanthinifaciens]UAK25239.1 hypothetical protein K8P63_03315 [Sphingomonas nostoxanthinifaciens]
MTIPTAGAPDRRTVVRGAAAFGLVAGLPGIGWSEVRSPSPLQWIVSTQATAWQPGQGAAILPATTEPADINVDAQARAQTIEGFGACFNELGWDALQRVAPPERAAIMTELFGPDGARFNLCRMPVGANDFSRDWYSYDETRGDFALDHFSIANDETSLVPFIAAALRHQPKLRLWASPWSPPTWMKRNGHYASVPNRPGWPANGLRPDQIGHEGTDMFILEPRYLDAYARYFGRFVDAYAAKGIRIGMVMPQNEFNSAQPFPSCCWTAQGLATFIPYLGREMGKRGVEIFFGTLERANDGLLQTVLDDPAAAPFVKGVGAQWAGKGAIAAIHHDHPKLRLYQSEQECGDGRNDWRYCRYTWSLMKQYLRNGATGYDYWNIALAEGGVSRWGWAQNSLVTVNQKSGAWRFNHEYWLLKHLSHFVREGAVRIEAVSWTGYDDALAFQNPDGSTIVLVHNPLSEPMPLTIGVGTKQIQATLPADSFSTFAI